MAESLSVLHQRHRRCRKQHLFCLAMENSRGKHRGSISLGSLFPKIPTFRAPPTPMHAPSSCAPPTPTMHDSSSCALGTAVAFKLLACTRARTRAHYPKEAEPPGERKGERRHPGIGNKWLYYSSHLTFTRLTSRDRLCDRKALGLPGGRRGAAVSRRPQHTGPPPVRPPVRNLHRRFQGYRRARRPPEQGMGSTPSRNTWLIVARPSLRKIFSPGGLSRRSSFSSQVAADKALWESYRPWFAEEPSQVSRPSYGDLVTCFCRLLKDGRTI